VRIACTAAKFFQNASEPCIFFHSSAAAWLTSLGQNNAGPAQHALIAYLLYGAAGF
jgi:hypothetical protein